MTKTSRSLLYAAVSVPALLSLWAFVTMSVPMPFSPPTECGEILEAGWLECRRTNRWNLALRAWLVLVPVAVFCFTMGSPQNSNQ